MKADSKRWSQVEASKFPHEKEALACLREALHDNEPYRGWSNLEFVAQDGSINEVDALVLTPKGIFLVEIKSRGGRLSGDAGTWTWKTDRREIVTDNPLYLANQKAKKLKSLLQGQRALGKFPVPYVHAVVFLSAKATEAAGVLIPADDQSELPVLDGRPIPVLSPAQYARVPHAWLEAAEAGRKPARARASPEHYRGSPRLPAAASREDVELVSVVAAGRPRAGRRGKVRHFSHPP